MPPNSLDVSNFDKICRLCLEEKKTLHSIFNQKSKAGDNLPLPQKIESCASVTVSNLFTNLH